jgi:hypothetical protein
MTKVTIFYCDRCKKELSEFVPLRTELGARRRGTAKVTNMQLCKECSKVFQTVIKQFASGKIFKLADPIIEQEEDKEPEDEGEEEND